MALTRPRTCRSRPGAMGKRLLSCGGRCIADATLPACFLQCDSAGFKSHPVPTSEKSREPPRFWPRRHRATELTPRAAHLWMCYYVSRTNACLHDACSGDTPQSPAAMLRTPRPHTEGGRRSSEGPAPGPSAGSLQRGSRSRLPGPLRLSGDPSQPPPDVNTMKVPKPGYLSPAEPQNHEILNRVRPHPPNGLC